MNCTPEALALRLEALDCPFHPYPDISDPSQAQKLISWLEDTHIRLLPLDSRAPLYSSQFLPALRTYLRTLSAPKPIIPATVTQISIAAAWLVDLALHLHYSDDAALYNEPIDPWHGLCVPTETDSVKDPAVNRASVQLLKSVDVQADEGLKSDDMLCVAADIVEHLVKIPQGLDINIPYIDDIPLGFGTGDKAVDKTAKVMRALHVRQLRQVQDDINHIIADMQALTANPKTNSKLGKVGR